MPTSSDVAALMTAHGSPHNVVTVRRAYLDLFPGDLDLALFAHQCEFWTLTKLSAGGWFYKTAAEWFLETTISPAQVRRCASKLEALGLLERKRRRLFPGGPAIWFYRANLGALALAITAMRAKDAPAPVAPLAPQSGAEVPPPPPQQDANPPEPPAPKKPRQLSPAQLAHNAVWEQLRIILKWPDKMTEADAKRLHGWAGDITKRGFDAENLRAFALDWLRTWPGNTGSPPQISQVIRGLEAARAQAHQPTAGAVWAPAEREV